MPHVETNVPYHRPTQHPANPSSTTSSSPVAPAYSPITPKVQPALPAHPQVAFVPPEHGGDFTFSVPESQPPQPTTDQQIAPPVQYIPQPPNKAFSSEDATDAIALRAAISTLQFQKKRAQDDLKTLADIKRLAISDPNHFKEELAAGRLNEQRHKLGDLRAILDGDSDDSDDDSPARLGAAVQNDHTTVGRPEGERSSSPEIPDSQPTQTSSFAKDSFQTNSASAKQFPPIPGPQNVVRMPYVSWDKYGIVGAPLDSMHAQQQRWPGSTAYGRDRGREYAIAAPYSPWLDSLDAQPGHSEGRKDSAATPTPTPSATGTISEHPMETRSRQ